MHTPNNVLFTGATALFNEKLFLKCPEGKLQGFIPVEEIPSEDPDEIPISLDEIRLLRHIGKRRLKV